MSHWTDNLPQTREMRKRRQRALQSLQSKVNPIPEKAGQATVSTFDRQQASVDQIIASYKRYETEPPEYTVCHISEIRRNGHGFITRIIY